MTQTTHGLVLAGLIALIAVFSFVLSGRTSRNDGFFDGREPDGRAPSLWTLVLSQVTTWKR